MKHNRQKQGQQEKRPLREDMRLLRRALACVHRFEPAMLPVTVIGAICTAAAPFVNIYFSARILNELTGEKNIQRLIFLAALTAAGLTVPAAALGADSGRLMAGVDVSVYQGEIDFQAVKDSGVETVYIRAGYGTDSVDRYFQRNAQEAARTGLHFGFYWYVTARTEAEARQQARSFADVIRGKGYDCRPAMDLEDFTGLTDAQVNAVGLAFLRELEQLTGVTPLLYTNVSSLSSGLAKTARLICHVAEWVREVLSFVSPLQR